MIKSTVPCPTVSLERHLTEVFDLKLKAERESITAELKSNADALRLQATEYERRLDELNHAHAAITSRNAEFVNVGKFDDFQREFREHKGKVEAFITTAAGSKSGSAKTIGIIISIFGFVLTCLWIFQTILMIGLALWQLLKN